MNTFYNGYVVIKILENSGDLRKRKIKGKTKKENKDGDLNETMQKNREIHVHISR